MANGEIPKEESPEAHEQKRHFEEQLLSTKDGILRLWERTRHLQERLGLAEQRQRRLIWLLIAIVLSSGGVVAFLTIRYILPLQAQVAALQTGVPALQERIHALEQAEPPAVEQPKVVETQPNEQAIAEAMRRLAPEIVSAVLKNALHVDSAGNVGIGTATPEATLHVVGNLLGAAKGTANEALRVVVGRLDPKTTRWAQYTDGGIYVDVDTSSAGFSSTPLYFTSLGGHTNNWLAQGATSIYYPTAKGFRVHVSYPELTVAKAKEWGWSISWIAVGK